MSQTKKVKRHIFGTDGVRGVANQEPMTPETALKLGRAVSLVLHDPVAEPREGSGRSKPPSSRIRSGDTQHRTKILIGKDTRLSGYMLETALASGICSRGADVLLVGPMPTPGVAFLTRSMRADAGVVISASHNPYQDNGIKFFSWDGFKLPDDVEARMEEMICNGETEEDPPTASRIGKAMRIADAVGRYVVFLKSTFPRHLTLEGLRIVVDCGHGAAYRVVPEVLSELGAQVIPIGVQPDGENINRSCGALHPEAARDVLLHERADFAVSLDGDADRAIFVDDTGDILDGDQILAICAKDMQETGTLRGRTVVATVMSNLGLERSLAERGARLVRTPVGDRYVVERMREGGYNVGGEQSGHIVLSDFATTGDGIIAALQVLAVVVQAKKPASEVTRLFDPLPQLLRNVRFNGGAPLEDKAVQAAIRDGESRLGKAGRLVIRKSGTEPVIRVMAEGEDEALVDQVVGSICQTIEQWSGARRAG
jgi:phosphoglucosamine mutase